MDDKETLLDQYREALKNIKVNVSQDRGNAIGDIYDIDLDDGDFIIGSDISASLSFDDTINLSNITISSDGTSPYYTTTMIGGIGGGGNAGPYTVTGTGWDTFDPTPSAKISLKGDDADIDINGVSLCDTIKGIQDRLNILCPDPGMEAEWDDLRAIREQYEAKLAECREKSRAWKALKNGT